ncbi:hypothetical protein EUX98_g6654 [Antrodiella citrinella]|uniref:GH16 domain-containing protein n=1 Tax=Antrodiella citrinella TaxID=2447956 RepID=A0A4S4MNG4_9APHY|nr:hypothetical protein EUX98_g6654 [Antrodiella citrinella]
MKSFAPIVSLFFAARSLGATFSQTDSHQGTDFLSSFSHQAIADPTHGRVNYVDQATALAQNLTYASGDTFIIRADDTTVLSASGPGRNSVRLQSNKQYLNHVAVFNIRHMPQGCGTWPAVWELFSTPTGNNCDTAATDNSGCGVQSPATNSYGPSFNSAGGGWYAMERSDSDINVWFWSRNGNVPSDVSSGATSIDTDNWGEPFASFPDTSCDIDSHFGEQNIIINLTFCGDWAGAVYSSDGCPSDCVDYVNNNPSAFTNAYFDFEWVKIYQ